MGISPLDREGKAYATLWFTFIYVPLTPLKRLLVRFEAADPKFVKFRTDKFYTLGETPLYWDEVISTYLTALIVGGPVIAMAAAQAFFNYPISAIPNNLFVPGFLWTVSWIVIKYIQRKQQFSPKETALPLIIKDVKPYKGVVQKVTENVKKTQWGQALEAKARQEVGLTQSLAPSQKKILAILTGVLLVAMFSVPIVILQTNSQVNDLFNSMLALIPGKSSLVLQALLKYLLLVLVVALAGLPLIFFVKRTLISKSTK
jgi:hypothetical protein